MPILSRPLLSGNTARTHTLTPRPPQVLFLSSPYRMSPALGWPPVLVSAQKRDRIPLTLESQSVICFLVSPLLQACSPQHPSTCPPALLKRSFIPFSTPAYKSTEGLTFRVKRLLRCPSGGPCRAGLQGRHGVVWASRRGWASGGQALRDTLVAALQPSALYCPVAAPEAPGLLWWALPATLRPCVLCHTVPLWAFLLRSSLLVLSLMLAPSSEQPGTLWKQLPDPGPLGCWAASLSVHPQDQRPLTRLPGFVWNVPDRSNCLSFVAVPS